MLIILLIFLLVFSLNVGMWITLIVKIFKNGRGHPSTKRFFLFSFIILLSTFILGVGGFLWFWGQQVGGPAPFAVSSQAEKYIESLHGDQIRNLNIIYKSHKITSESPSEGHYILEYQFNDNKGILKASYSNYSSNKQFQFSEVKETILNKQ